jgi:hypothetical protein
MVLQACNSRAGEVAQVVACLLRKCEAEFKPQYHHKKKKKEKRKIQAFISSYLGG